MNLIRRILALLQPQERRKVLTMVASVLFSALLDFAGLAVLLPVLYFLLEGGEQLQVALLFSALAFVVIVLKCLLTTYFLRYRNKVLMSFYKRLSFSMYSSYYDRGLLFIREQGSNKLGYDINSMSYSFSQNLLSPLFRVAGDVLLLDEATSALDNETEYEINQTLLQLKESYQGLTILSIAHRDSSLGYCDRIVRITKEG